MCASRVLRVELCRIRTCSSVALSAGGCHTRRAFGLLETLMAMALLLILLTLLAQVLVPMGRGTRRGATQIELQQLAQVAMDRLAADLSSAPRAGINLVPPTNPASDPTLLSIQPLTTVTSTGGQEWSTTLFLYRHDPVERKLYRRQWPPEPPSVGRLPQPDEPFFEQPNPPPPAAPIATELATLAVGGAVLAGHVESFTVDLSVDPPRIQLVLKLGKESFELTRRLMLRNVRY